MPIRRLSRRAIAALMAAVLVTLLAALWAGVIRIGWAWPPLAQSLPGSHGPLMVCGFLGTLIAIERAVGLGKYWMLAAPTLSAGGALLTLTPAPPLLAALTITVGSAVFVAGMAQLLRIHVATFTLTLVLGATLWLVGNLLWLAGQPLAVVTLWWMGYLVVTIAGERLELSRMLRLRPRDTWLFVLCLSVMIAGMMTAPFAYGTGVRLLGVGLVAMALWLLRYDIAWRRLKAGGLARYSAICLLTGYFWMGVGGVIGIARGGMTAGPLYDAFLHSVFLGFVFTMIFAHAPIVLPAVMGTPVPYTSRFYVHLVLLNAALVLRIAGDLLLNHELRRWGGLLSAIVLLLFLANTMAAAFMARRAAARVAAPLRATG